MPFSEQDDYTIRLGIRAGETPQRPSAGIDDLVWLFLQECWGSVPSERPSITQVCDTFPQFRSILQTRNTPVGRWAIGDLPSKLKLCVQSLRTSQSKPDRRKFFVKLKYVAQEHTTSPNMGAVDGVYTWHCTYF